VVAAFSFSGTSFWSEVESMSETFDFTRYLGLTPSAILARCSDEALRRAFDRGEIRGFRDPAGTRWLRRDDVLKYAARRRRKRERVAAGAPR
jgi:hypothetical protein